MMELKGIQFLILCLGICISVGYARAPKKIVNGQLAGPGMFPHQVSLQHLERDHFCGGSILDSTHILTAAHCVVDENTLITIPADQLRVITGVVDNQAQDDSNTFAVSAIIRHRSYQGKPYLHDIAIVKLADEIQFNEFQKPILLPDRDISAGELVITTGWGAQWADYELRRGPQSRYLHKLQLRVYDQNKCRYLLGNRITPGQMCVEHAQGTGICFGDSGGPLVHGNRLIGITSWLPTTCAGEYPDIFIRVYHYVQWINDVIRLTS